jgi:hypothetical protein
VIISLENRGGTQPAAFWSIEKTAIALAKVARLVDLGEEPDTNAWYREAVRVAAYPMVGRLAAGCLASTVGWGTKFD